MITTRGGDVWNARWGETDYLPRSVEACRTSQDSEGRLGWTLAWINRRTGETGSFPFACRSWRCCYCSARVILEDRDRISEALGAHDAWCAITLTIDPGRWVGRWAAFRGLYYRWNRLIKRLRRRYPGDLAYIATAERTRKGWPHLHAVVHSEGLLAELRALGLGEPYQNRAGEWKRTPRWVTRVLRPMVRGAGWARVLHAAELNTHEALAPYLAHHSADPLASPRSRKAYQRPLNAPPHFRRLRASRGCLPPRRSVLERDPDRLVGVVRLPNEAVKRTSGLDFQALVGQAIKARAQHAYRRRLSAQARTARIRAHAIRFRQLEVQMGLFDPRAGPVPHDPG